MSRSTENQWNPMLNADVFNHGLKPAPIGVYAALLTYARKSGMTEGADGTGVTHRGLAARVGLRQPESVAAHLKTLTDAGFVRLEGRRYRHNVYRVRLHGEDSLAPTDTRKTEHTPSQDDTRKTEAPNPTDTRKTKEGVRGKPRTVVELIKEIDKPPMAEPDAEGTGGTVGNEESPSRTPENRTSPWQSWEGNSANFAARWGPYIGKQISREDYRTELDRRKARDVAELHTIRKKRAETFLRGLDWLSDEGFRSITALADDRGVPPQEVQRLAQECLPHHAPTISNRESLFRSKVGKWTEADVKVSKRWEEIGD